MPISMLCALMMELLKIMSYTQAAHLTRTLLKQLPASVITSPRMPPTLRLSSLSLRAQHLQMTSLRRDERRDETRHAIECGHPASDTPHIITRRQWNNNNIQLSLTSYPPVPPHRNERNNLSQPTHETNHTPSGAFTRPRGVSPSWCSSIHPFFLTLHRWLVAHRLSLTPAPFPGASPLLSKRHTQKSHDTQVTEFGRQTGAFLALGGSLPCTLHTTLTAFWYKAFSDHACRKLASLIQTSGGRDQILLQDFRQISPHLVVQIRQEVRVLPFSGPDRRQHADTL